MRKDIFDAFASPVRLQLLCCLAKGRRNVQDLITNCGLSQSAVSQHLEKLRSAGLIVGAKEGKFVYYSLVHPQSAKLAQEIKAFIEEIS
jgi:DNA-binding transcriptional ArsR family regulator